MSWHRVALCFPLASIVLALFPLEARGGEIPRDEYLRYVPLAYPKIVRQTDASRDMHLYGNRADPNYRDVAPLDGVDDERGKMLLALGVRFAPYMVRNTTAFPMSARQLMADTKSSVLYVDEWQLTDAPMRRSRTLTIDFTKVVESPCPDGMTDGVQNTIIKGLQRTGALDDCELLALMRDFNPNKPEDPYINTLAVNPDSEEFKTLFFNFPGDSPETWKQEYRNVLSKEIPRKFANLPLIYLHPFINSTGVTSEVPRYEFVLQFWFFYPFNDGGNKHEGDWEHLGVTISPRSKIGEQLTEDDIKAILARNEATFEGDDPLVIARVDHYIHNSVMRLDYSQPNVYLPRKEWDAKLDKRTQEKVGENRLHEAVRYRAWMDNAETIPNTHPIVFIGADSKGPELLIYPPGARNQDSHASYPFPGLYKNIGPAAAAEEITRHFDHRKYLGKEPKPLPSDVMAYNDPAKLLIVPDWERVIDLAWTDVRVRAEWGWLLLPIRWGYPATASPFAGIISHAETGNLAPVGPSFSTGWNRSGVSATFTLYDPHQFSGLIPLSPLDSLQNSFGYANILILAAVTLPPFDILTKLILSPTSQLFTGSDPVFFPTARIPFRFTSLGAGYTHMVLTDEWTQLFLNRQQGPQLRNRILAATNLPVNEATAITSDANGWVVQFEFHLSEHWVSVNSLRHTNSQLGLNLVLQDSPNTFEIRGNLDFWEWAGTIRYNILTDRFQPFLMLGYGLSWYRLTGVSTNGLPLATPDSNWIRQPTISPFANWLPNTWHYGIGVEFIPILSRAPLPKGIDASIKVEFAVYNHDLGVKFDNTSNFNIGDAETSIHRPVLDITGVLSF